MSIVLNEREWAEYAIASRQLGRSPMETLNRVARYYYQCEGYRRKEVKQKVDFSRRPAWVSSLLRLQT